MGGIFVAVVIISAAIMIGVLIASTSVQPTISSTTSMTCLLTTVNVRDVYDEPNNEITRVGAIVADTYRVVAFGGTDWAAVDWQRSGIEVNKENLQFLDWVRLVEGVDILTGYCEATPRLATRLVF